MTGGRVVILGTTGKNIGAGMTGGAIYSFRDLSNSINNSYIKQANLNEEDQIFLNDFLSNDLQSEFACKDSLSIVPLEDADE